MKASTGLRNAMLVTGSLKSQMDGGFVDIYSGTPPTTADDAITVSHTKLCRVSLNATATGVTFDATVAGGVVNKAASETWSGTNLASGTATFFRHVLSSDTGAASTTEKRIQGTVGTVGEDLNLSSVGLVSGNPQAINFYSVALPTL